jgi:hypothetical protein
MGRNFIRHRFDARCDVPSRLSFQSRGKWTEEGLADKATWTDKQGREYNFVGSFFTQWTKDVPEWYMGVAGQVMAPTTNNGAEVCIRNTRNDVGNVVGSVGATLYFLLQEVQAVSDNMFDPKATRKIEDTGNVLICSVVSSALTKLKLPTTKLGVFCCQPRQDSDDDNVCERAAITQGRAASMAKAFLKQFEGEATAMEQLLEFTGPAGVRVFGFHKDLPFCSCPAFCNRERRCFHTVGLAIHLGELVLPDTIDPTLLSSERQHEEGARPWSRPLAGRGERLAHCIARGSSSQAKEVQRGYRSSCVRL